MISEQPLDNFLPAGMVQALYPITIKNGYGKMNTMKSRCLFHYASTAALAALLPFTLMSSRAASAPSSLDASISGLQQAQFQPVAWEEAKRHKLRHAYWLLDQADRDYKGHRGKAMEEIKKAAKIMGLDLHGEGYSGEHQAWSDERLREARQLLVDIVDKSHEGEHEHIWKAIQEIDKALEVR
jgi:hypothetical protein